VEARFQWSRALSFKPEADQMKVIEAKVRDGLGPVDTTQPTPGAAPATPPAPSDNSKGADGQSGSSDGGRSGSQDHATNQTAG
jgi:hypothetical protein